MYLYIFEDGTYRTGGEPTPGDVECMNDGLLIVLYADAEIKEFDPANGELIDVPKTEVQTIEGEKYHVQG